MCRNIILPVVLYGCETWSLTYREKHKLRNISGAKRDGITGKWRRLHKEELYDVHFSPNIIRVIMLCLCVCVCVCIYIYIYYIGASLNHALMSD
jgi:hypothetical protein